jgi:hypothetical protein
MLLIQSANSDLDKETEEIESWNWIKGEISFMMRVYSELMKLTLINELAKSYLFEYVSFCYDVVSSYIKANEQVREDLEDFYNTEDYKDRQEEINTLRNIMRESEENQKEAEFFLVNYLEPSFPEIEKEVKTCKVSFFILHSFKGIYPPIQTSSIKTMRTDSLSPMNTTFSIRSSTPSRFNSTSLRPSGKSPTFTSYSKRVNSSP